MRLKNLFSKPYQTVTAARAAALAEGGAVLLDVREPQEWQAAMRPGPGTSRWVSSLAGRPSCPSAAPS